MILDKIYYSILLVQICVNIDGKTIHYDAKLLEIMGISIIG